MWCFPEKLMWLLCTDLWYHFSRLVALDNGLEKLTTILGVFWGPLRSRGMMCPPSLQLLFSTDVLKYYLWWSTHSLPPNVSLQSKSVYLENSTLPLCFLHLSILGKPGKKGIVTYLMIATVSVPNLYLLTDLSDLVWELH